MPLNIYTSNRMENLVEALAGVVEEPLSLPMAPEVIVVQSKGMQRWVSMELARRFGVWANCAWPFPNAMMWRLYNIVMPEIPVDEAAFAPEVLAWKIMQRLPGFLDRGAFAQLRNYLTGDGDGLKLFQLACRIADTFDQYTLFRPEMLAEWEKAADGAFADAWQALLWRTLAADGGGWHRGRMKEEFLRRMKEIKTPIDGMPERIAVFGISYLPAHHMEALAAISAVTDVNLFLLSPTREYWSDIVSKKAKARLAEGEAALRSEGHPLLASLGRMGRDFSDMVIEIGDVASLHEELYEEPGEETLLKQMQTDILNLSEGVPGTKKRTLTEDDRSIQVHSCHSPLREIEILHDNILALLDGMEGLMPRDIVVMTPDIETYAPYIASVFESFHDPSIKIPYSIADRRLKSEGRIAEAMLKLLDLPESRFTSVSLLDILAAAPVQRRFGLEEADIDRIRDWVEKTAIRWGMDEKSRLDLGLPGYRENSWRAGLDRLLLGYALPDEKNRLFNGILPFDEMEGADTLILGKLADFIDRIDAMTKRLAAPRTLAGWRAECARLLSDFIAADEKMEDELAAVSGVVARMGELAETSGYDGMVSASVIKAWLSMALERAERGLGFITGGVTFCAMLPMRSIPFRVVALIGINDGAFPRQNFTPGFDLAARNPRRGDRSLRDEDRYLFLEALLSARDCFYVSYVGQSIKDNSEIPPSVLVSELLDAIDRGFEREDGEGIAEKLLTKHRLQAFNRDYFSPESPLFSYSAANFEALLERDASSFRGLGARRDADGFLKRPLPPPDDGWREVPLLQLHRFFRNPAKFFLEKRLEIAMEEDDVQSAGPLPKREPFSLERLDGYKLKQELLDRALRGENTGAYLTVARSRGLVPPGRHGGIVFETAERQAQEFSRRVQERIGDAERLAPLDVDFPLGGFRLTGRLEDLWSEGMIRFRSAKMKGKDTILAWIDHLVLNASRREGYPQNSLLIMEDEEKVFLPVAAPLPILQSLLELYWQGLQAPLRFFPASSVAYAAGGKWSLDEAQKKWNDRFPDIPGECRDASFRLCFGETAPFDDAFENIAHTVMEPLLDHLEGGRR